MAAYDENAGTPTILCCPKFSGSGDWDSGTPIKRKAAMQQLCYNLYGFQDWSNKNMRGKKHVPNDLTRQHVEQMTAKGATQPMVAGVLGIEEK